MQAQSSGQMSRNGGRIAVGCVTAISLPFVIMGAFTIREGISKVGHDEGAWIAAGAGALFVAVGILFIAGVSYGTRPDGARADEGRQQE